MDPNTVNVTVDATGGADQPASNPVPQPPAQQVSQDEPEKGFPANTPLKEMTAEQQIEYWKDKARKHEAHAKHTKDYDDVVRERDELRTKAMTEQEKAVAAARAEGKAEAAREASTSAATAILTSSLKARNVSDDALPGLLKPVNVAAFVGENGEVNVDMIHAYANSIAPASTPMVPDMGQGGGSARKPVSSVSAGVDLYNSRHKK